MAKIDRREVLCSVGEMLGLELKASEYVGTSEHLNLLSWVVFTEKNFQVSSSGSNVPTLVRCGKSF